MNIFKAIKVYNSWTVTDSRDFSQEEKDYISKAEVVEGDFGLSVCFILVGGGKSYIPLDANSSANVGDSVDLDSAKLVTLSKDGEEDIFRVLV